MGRFGTAGLAHVVERWAERGSVTTRKTRRKWYLPDAHGMDTLGTELGHGRGSARLVQSLLNVYISTTAGGALLVSVNEGKGRGRRWKRKGGEKISNQRIKRS